MKNAIQTALRTSVTLFRKSGFTLSKPNLPTPEIEQKLKQRAEELKNATVIRELTPEEYKHLDDALDEHRKGQSFSKY